MPYPEDPFALKLKTAHICPKKGCGKRLLRETKDQSSSYLGQLRCSACGFTGPVTRYQAPKLKGV